MWNSGMKYVTFLTFFTCCEKLVPIFHGVKFAKCEICCSTQRIYLKRDCNQYRTQRIAASNQGFHCLLTDCSIIMYGNEKYHPTTLQLEMDLFLWKELENIFSWNWWRYVHKCSIGIIRTWCLWLFPYPTAHVFKRFTPFCHSWEQHWVDTFVFIVEACILTFVIRRTAAAW